MWSWIVRLDRLLRGETTSLPELRAGRLDIPIGGLSLVGAALGAIYGVCMGLFAITGNGSGNAMQIVASMVKLPALFFLTLLVTFPSLYVFNALVGSRLMFHEVLRLLVGALAVMLAVLSSLGPIVAFFAISTTNYSFMLLLNVIVCALSGILGLGFLLQTLHRITLAQIPLRLDPVPAEPVSESTLSPGALDALQGQMINPNVRIIFRIWIIVFGLVGGQMAWVLRPFVGNPTQPFTWFRARSGNFFEAIWQLFTGFFQ